MTPQNFIAAISEAAKKSAKVTKIPASFTIAEAALESGWGTSKLAVEGFNLFGVKADRSWNGDTLSINTKEFLKGRWVIIPALWRKYTTWLECIQDHAAFLLDNPRYKPAFQHNDGAGFATAVAAAGYATDPDYASKIISVIHAHGLAALDT